MFRSIFSSGLTTLLVGSLLGCHKDCTPQPQPSCYSGKVVAYTCMMGVLVDVDPAYPIGARAVLSGNRFVGNNVIAVANPANLPSNGQVGQQLYFTYTNASTPSPMACLAADGPTTPIPILNLNNISTVSCDSVRTR